MKIFSGKIKNMRPTKEENIKPWKSGKCRTEYGWELTKITDQRTCAYCGLDLYKTYESWLVMCRDHVIPYRECKKLEIPGEWIDGHINCVLACSACNGFCNRYEVDLAKLKLPPKPDKWTLPYFYKLRNAVFEERKSLILQRHEKEKNKFKENRRSLQKTP